jgi:outer membrane protein assembly factor BamB
VPWHFTPFSKKVPCDTIRKNKSSFMRRSILIGFFVIAAIVICAFLGNYQRIKNRYAPSNWGVTLKKTQTTQHGINLIFFSHEQAAYLMDSDGQMKHRWSNKLSNFNFSEIDGKCYHSSFKDSWPLWRCGWQAAQMNYRGELHVIAGTEYLAKLDRAGQVIWSLPGSFHSDLDTDENNQIFTIKKSYSYYNYNNKDVKIIDEFLVRVDSMGKILEELSVLDLLIRAGIYTTEPYKSAYSLGKKVKEIPAIDNENRTVKDILHFNSIKVAKKDFPPLARKGDYLVSFRNLDLIGIIDHKTRKFVWTWGPKELSGQHNVTFLDNGNILIFDNRDHQSSSRVLELSPYQGTIVWQLPNSHSDSFFSAVKGSAQRLPNGNTLITSSHQGRVFEVTRGGTVVWNYQSPPYRGILFIENSSQIPVRTTRIFEDFKL